MTLEQAAQEAIRHLNANRLPQAENLARQVLGINPNHTDALNVLGVVAYRVGRADAAVELLKRVIQIDPSRADAWNNLGESYRALRMASEAVDAYRKAIARDPKFAPAYNNLGIVLALTGQYEGAVNAWQQAIAIRPDYASAHNNLGNVFGLQGRTEEAIAAHRNAVRLEPNDPWKHSNLLRDMNFSSSISPEQLLEEHKTWWQRHGAPHARTIGVHANDRNPDRKLRMGFLSPDFRKHSVAYFLEPIYSNRDRSAFEFYSYAQVPVGDEVTERFASMSDGWRSTVGQSDEAVAQQIRADRIDVLVELAGHTADSRVLVCARKPAPVQVNYLGYPFSTGLATMDYRLTDEIADPPGQSERLHTETLIRLPMTAWCYRPPADAPAVIDTPAARNGFVTFGSFNSFWKVSPEVADAWVTILNRMPTAKLMLKGPAMGDPGLRGRATETFTSRGVDASRVILVDYEPSGTNHLSRYGEVDVALDTFPYCGTTTTCEALWMGVPVLTFAGRIHQTRVGASLLTSLELKDWITSSLDQYIDVACSFAADIPQLSALRSGMRDRMERSALRDEIGFARDFEAAIRQMWKTWCAKRA